ncbi:MAG TPA: lipopolysaccharide kinase InaA family protein [Methylophilus sp.]
MTYLSNQFATLLQQHQLATFEQLWAHAIDWFETPNERRGGWSGVGRLNLDAHNGAVTSLFVKKQQNHGRRTLLHPVVGEPTFRREFKRLQFLAQHQFTCPKVVMYGESQVNNQQRAVLVTEALTDFVPLDVLMDTWFLSASIAEKNSLMVRVATEIRRFHDLGLVHRALYPKHIFIKLSGIKLSGAQPEVALIDLEKARFSWLGWYRTIFDLAALNRHTVGVRRTQRLKFFMYYMDVKQLDWFSKRLCRLISQRSKR